MNNPKADIQQLLDVSEDRYNNLVIDSGFDYLSRQRAWTKRGIEKFMKSGFFWNWWWKNWLAADAALLKNELSKMAVEEYLRAHTQAHSNQMPKNFWRVLEVTHDGRVRKNKKALVPLKERLKK